MFTVLSQDRAPFFRALARWDEGYDVEAGLLKKPFSSPGYHTTLTGGWVHPTRESLMYAVACLDAGDEERRTRAEGIIRCILTLQETDPAQATYGIWPWFYEEPLAQMSPPDWNWADFCGVQLLQALLDHRERLDAGLCAAMETALRHACQAIIRRDVQPSYTNIALMGAYVTLVAGERLNWPAVAAYGRQRLAKFHVYTLEHDGIFDEYNSPTYTRVALAELSRMALHVQAPEARAQLDELLLLAWRHLARHFHAPTRQWAGPHSRCYRTVQGTEFLSYLQYASQGRLAYLPADELTMEIDWPRLGLAMPAAVLPYFAPPEQPRTEVEIYHIHVTSAPAAGVAYLHPQYTLAAISHGDLWNQRRAVVAYWGTADNPSFLRLRMLVDGYDFSSGYLFTAQRDGALLAAVTSVTDWGRTHLSLDPIRDGRLTASDWRVRLEIGGPAAAGVASGPWAATAPLTLALDGLSLTVQTPGASGIGQPVAWTLLGPEQAPAVLQYPQGQSGDPQPQAAIDAILYHGPQQEFILADLRPLYVALALAFNAPSLPAPTLQATQDTLTLHWPGVTDQITAPIGPVPRAQLFPPPAERREGLEIPR